MGKELADEAGQNRVSAQTPNKRIDIDLTGKGHFDKATGEKIDTPHVHEAKLNKSPDGKVNTSGESVRPATKEDIRTARKLIDEDWKEQ